MKQRQCEGRSFAGSRLGHTQQITPLQKQRDRLRLNGRRCLVSRFVERLQDCGREREIVKRRGHDKQAPPAHEMSCALAGILGSITPLCS